MIRTQSYIHHSCDEFCKSLTLVMIEMWPSQPLMMPRIELDDVMWEHDHFREIKTDQQALLISINGVYNSFISLLQYYAQCTGKTFRYDNNNIIILNLYEWPISTHDAIIGYMWEGKRYVINCLVKMSRHSCLLSSRMSPWPAPSAKYGYGNLQEHLFDASATEWDDRKKERKNLRNSRFFV